VLTLAKKRERCGALSEVEELGTCKKGTSVRDPRREWGVPVIPGKKKKIPPASEGNIGGQGKGFVSRGGGKRCFF